jgi:hypothetical protein
MEDNLEINPIESAGEGNETQDSPEKIEGVESGVEIGPTTNEVMKIVEEREKRVNEIVDLVLNGPGINDLLRKLVRDPSSSDMVGEDELRRIVEIEKEITEEVAPTAIKDMRRIASSENPNVKETPTYTPETEETVE